MRAVCIVLGALAATACSFEVVPPSGGGGPADGAVLPDPIDATPPPDTGPDANQQHCGDGVVDPGEDCDDSNDDPSDACVSCAWARCGDGHVRSVVEQCDDGNTAFGDACSGCLACSIGTDNVVWDANGHCYSWFAGALGWDDAIADCAAYGTHAATIADIGENGAVTNLIPAATEAWLGYSDLDVEGTYASIIGDGPGLEAWHVGQPDDFMGLEDCVELRSDATWNDQECPMSVAYVCEDDGWALLDGDRHGYKVFYVPLAYADAVAVCDGLGAHAHLATVRNVPERDLVAGLVGVRAWIGLDDRAQEGTFTWITGEPLGFSNWHPGEPNAASPGQDCVAMGFFEDDLWSDDNCTDLLPFVCEVE